MDLLNDTDQLINAILAAKYIYEQEKKIKLENVEDLISFLKQKRNRTPTKPKRLRSLKGIM